MANEITDGALSWTARIDLSELANDAKSLSEIFAKIGDAEIDTTTIDNILKEQTAKEVDYRKDVAAQVKQINADVVADAKSKADKLQEQIQKTTLTSPVSNPNISGSDIIAQAKQAYESADPVTRKFIDDLLEYQKVTLSIQASQNELRKAVDAGAISWEEYYAAFEKNSKAAVENEATFKQNSIPYDNQNNPPSNDPVPADTLNKANSAYTKLRQLKAELTSLKLDGKDNTPEFENTLNEATELEHALKNTNTQLELASSNVAGIKVLGEAFRGVLGGLEAFQGISGFLTEDNKQFEEIIKNTTSLIATVQGLNEVGTVLAKNSPFNAFLKQILNLNVATRAQTAVQEEQNVVQEVANTEAEQAVVVNAAQVESKVALNAATGEQIAVTETATVAQEGLNAAMLANPGVLLIAGLIGAYVLYEQTIGKTTDAERQAKATHDALIETQERSAEAIAKEQSQLEVLLITAKDETLSRGERQDALNKAIATYPEYLNSLKLENLTSQQSSELIARQIELIKERALVQAAQDVYADKLKKQVEAQAAYNDVLEEGGTAGEKFFAFIKGYAGINLTAEQGLENEKLRELKDATENANGALSAINKTRSDLAQGLREDVPALDAYFNKFNLLADKFAGVSLVPKAPFFDPKLFDPAKKKAIDAAEALVASTVQGTQAYINAQKQLLAVQNQYEQTDPRITDEGQKKTDSQKYLADIASLNRQANQLILQQNAQAADALVLQLKNAGKEGTKEYYKAQKDALAANALSQSAQSQFDPSAKNKIQAQLTADIKTLSDNQKLYAINNQQDVLSAQLAAVRQGSDEEFALKIKLLDKQKEAEIINAKGNAAAITKIEAESDKKKNDLAIQTATAQANKLLQVQEDNLKILLTNATQGSEEYIADLAGLNNIAANKSVTDAITNAATKNPDIKPQDISASSTFDEKDALAYADKIESIDYNLALSIRRIWAETNAKNQQSDNEFINKQIEAANKLIDIKADLAKRANNATINNSDATESQKASAELNNNSIDIKAKSEEIDNFSKTVSKNYSIQGIAISNYIDTVKKDFNKIAELSDKDSFISHVFDGIKDPKLREQLEQLLKDFIEVNNQTENISRKKFDAVLNEVKEFGSLLSQAGDDIKGMNEGLGDTVGTLGEMITTGIGMVQTVESITDGIKELKKGTNEAGKALSTLDKASIVLLAVTYVIKAVSAVVKLFSQAKKSAEESEAQMDAYQTGLVVNQIKYNEELLQSKKIQDQLTQGVLDQLNAQIQLNNEKKTGYQTDLDTLTNLLAAQGEYISGEHTEKYGGFLGVARKTKVVQDFSSLGITPDLTNDQIAAILKEKETLNQLTGDTKIYADEWLAVYDNINQANDASAELKQQLTEAFAATTADDIAKSIVDGLSQGKTAAAQFGDDFNKIISNSLLASITNTLESGTVAKILQTFQDNIQADGSVTPLSPQEIETLKQQYSDAVNQGNALLQQAEALFPDLGSTLSGANTLAGAIQSSITEDTANELAGIQRGQYDIAKQSFQIAVSSLAVQQMIEAHAAQSLALFSQYLPYLPYLKNIYDNTTPKQIKRDFGL